MTGPPGASTALEIGGHYLSSKYIVSLGKGPVDDHNGLNGLTHFDEGIDNKAFLPPRLATILRSHRAWASGMSERPLAACVVAHVGRGWLGADGQAVEHVGEGVKKRLSSAV